jgi:hypothetical protein
MDNVKRASLRHRLAAIVDAATCALDDLKDTGTVTDDMVELVSGIRDDLETAVAVINETRGEGTL